MLGDRLWDWPLVWICFALTIVCVGVVIQSRGKWHRDKIGTRPLHGGSSSWVTEKLTVIGSIGALAFALGFVVMLVQALRP
jgi:hypothetical protein